MSTSKPMKSLVGNEKYEQLLIDAVKQYGEGRWCEIARALKIHGLTILAPKNLYHDWQKINPENIKVESQQIRDLIRFGIESKGMPSVFVRKWKELYGKNYLLLSKLRPTYATTMFNYLRHLIKILSRKKRQLRVRISRLKSTTMNRFLSIGDLKTEDEFCLKVIESTVLISNLILSFNQNYTKSKSDQYEIYAQITTKRQFDTTLEYMLLVDYLTRIKDKSIIKDVQLTGKCIYLKSTIQENKDSALYKLVFPVSQDLIFHSLYNDAIYDNPKDFVVDVTQIKKLNQLPQQLQEVKPQRLLTVRGRIRNKNKILFHSKHSVRFEAELLKNMNDDLESDPEIQKQIDELSMVNQFDIHPNIARPTTEECDQAIQVNDQMNQFVQDQLEKLKKHAYNLFKDRNQ